MRKGIGFFAVIVTIAWLVQIAYSAWVAYSFYTDLQIINSGGSLAGTTTTTGGTSGGTTGGTTGGEEGPVIPEEFDLTPYCSMSVENALDEQEIQDILEDNGYTAETIKAMLPMGCGDMGALSKPLGQLLSECSVAADALGGMGLTCD